MNSKEMETTYKFKIGQKVKMWSEDDEEWMHGEIDDVTSVSIFIIWINSTYQQQIFEFDYHKIKLNKR